MKLLEKAKEFTENIPAIWLLLKAKDTPKAAKVLAAVIVGYALSPIDLIPDFIPILGMIDDVILLPFLIGIFIRLMPPDAWERAKAEAKNLWTNGRPKHWYYAIPIVIFWLLVLFILLRFVFL